nr:hypothetical protein BaRGS_026053 [Batillaria attramentaria]
MASSRKQSVRSRSSHLEVKLSDVELESATEEPKEEKPEARVYNPIPIPPEVIPLEERFVLMKVNNFYLRHKETTQLALCQVKPPVLPKPVTRDPALEPKVYPKRVTKNFIFEDFTFCMEASMVIVDTQNGANVRHTLHANFSVLLKDGVHMLCARSNVKGNVEIILDPLVYGSEWRLHGVGLDDFLVESAQYLGWCLALDRNGLTLAPITPRDWTLLDNGVCDEYRRVTITSIPDFAITATATGVNVY